jgi:hypothetical protein
MSENKLMATEAHALRAGGGSVADPGDGSAEQGLTAR